MATIASRIKEAMTIRKMKQVDLVSLTGIGKSSISTYLSGEYEPKQRNIYKIAKALNVSEAWLMGYDVPMEREVAPPKKRRQELPRIGEGIFDGVPKEESNYMKKQILVYDFRLPQHEIYERFKDCAEYDGRRKLHEVRRIDVPILSHISTHVIDEKLMFTEENTEGYIYADLYDGADYFAFRIKDNSMNAARICEGDLVTIRCQDVARSGEIVAVLINDEEVALRRFSQKGDILALIPQSTIPSYSPYISHVQEGTVKILGVVINLQFTPV